MHNRIKLSTAGMMGDIGTDLPRRTESARAAPYGRLRFSAELWIWHARQEDGWTFLSVPPEGSEDRAYSPS